MRKLLQRGVLVVVCLFCCVLLSERSASAGASSDRPWVVVLRPRPAAVEPWPEGMQAVVAELVAGGYEPTLRESAAEDRDGLLAELAGVAADEGVLGAVIVARDGARGVAYVCTQKNGAVRVETGISEGAVGEGALALRITQLLGPPRFDVPQAETKTRAPAPPESASAPAGGKGLLIALEGGLTFSSDLTEPLPLAGFVVRKTVIAPLSIDASGWLALGASRLETSAGNVDVRAEKLALHLSFDPFRQNEIGLSLGLGGGVVWAHGEGQAAPGFSATNESTRVALLSARATAFFTHGPWSLLVSIEPGVLLPAVSVGAGNEVSRLGRPWTQTSVGLGWNL